MVQVRDIINYVEAKAGHALREDEGPRFGDMRKSLSGVTVCWMATPEAISFAAKRKHDLIICHESLTFPSAYFTYTKERPYLAWPTNVQRLELLAKNNIAVCRLHGVLDELFIYPAFCGQIGATQVLAAVKKPIYDAVFEKIYRIEPIRYAELIEKVKAATNMQAVRATAGDSDRIIQTVGVPWGGLALLANIWYLQDLIGLGPIDAMICGETDNYGIRFCQEVGIEVIETSHEVSESKGLALFAEDLAQAFKSLDVVYYDNSVIWRMF